MTEFLIKSTVSMTVLLAVYHIFLKKEKIHHFNRFYLLFSLILSFIVPFITIKVLSNTLSLPTAIAGIPFKDTIVLPIKNTAGLQHFNYPVIIAWLVYGSITSILLGKFVLNVRHLIKQIRTNTHVQYGQATLVLIPDLPLPYTFLNYIFLNKEKYHDKTIENELYTHELTHVKQKHTLDILLVEVIKTVFWFNPLVYGFKKAVQLNHEFLADEKVISSYNNAAYYQKLLLGKAEIDYTLNLASNLTYSITKQRLLMMTKSTSVIKSVLLKAVLAPVTIISIFFLLSLKRADREPTNFLSENHPSQQQWNEWKNDVNTIILINNRQMDKATLEKFNPTELISFSPEFITDPATPDNPKQQVFLYTQKGFEDHYNSLERPRPIEYKEVLSMRPQDKC